MLGLSLAMLFVLLHAQPSRADVEVVNFDNLFPGTVVTTQYQASHGVYWVEADPGFLPVARSSLLARSGSNVADISTCPPGCEFFTARTYGRLTTAALSVTLYAGYLGSTGDAQLTLTARDANGRVVDEHGPVTVTAGRPFSTLLRVTSTVPNIASFELYASNGALDTNEQVGFDDLTIETPDVTAPTTTITAGPSGLTNDPTPTFSFSSNEPGSTFQCRVDTASFAPCTSPHTTATLTPGAHTFAVRAIDPSGNVDQTPATRSFTVDTAAPETTITDGPSGPTTDSTPAFSFSSEAGATFQCRVDTAEFAPCGSPHTTADLLPGAHTFEVRAVDAAANVDPTPASRSFTVEPVNQAPPASPPDTSLVTVPAATTRDRTPTFSFRSNQAGTTFECSLDGAAFSPCSSPFAAPRLRAGSHTFRVRARSAAGGLDTTPASVTFAIPAELSDLPPPKLGRTFNAEPIGGGEVFVSVPPGSGPARARSSASVPGLKGRTFVALREARQVPVGSLFDTRRGRVRLQSARDSRGRVQSGEFSSGVFQVLQTGKRAARGLTELRLKGASFRRCGRTRRASAAARRSRRTIRRLRSNARGRFRTRGRYSAATVRGTVWTVTDRCDGTLTKVSRGAVVVRDTRRRKNILLRSGRSYLARARR